jgi:hypothetical protein
MLPSQRATSVSAPWVLQHLRAPCSFSGAIKTREMFAGGNCQMVEGNDSFGVIALDRLLR